MSERSTRPSAPRSRGTIRPPAAVPRPVPDHRTYAEWFVWTRRNLSSSDEVCHACAKAAVDALTEGRDPQDAARMAARYRHGPGWLKTPDAYTIAYAEWFDWARKHLGNDPRGHHRAASAAMEVLDAGGETAAAAEAAQRAAHTPLDEPLIEATANAPHAQEGPAPEL